MASIADLGRKVKEKHPGAYDDMDDLAVGRAVKAKFPGAYDDFSDDPAQAPVAPPPSRLDAFGKDLADLADKGGLTHPIDTLKDAIVGGAGNALSALQAIPAGVAAGIRTLRGDKTPGKFGQEMEAIRSATSEANRRSPAASMIGGAAVLAPMAAVAAPFSAAAPSGAGLGVAAARLAAPVADSALFSGASAAGANLDKPAAEIASRATEAATSPANLLAGIPAGIQTASEISGPARQSFAAWLAEKAGDRNIKAAGAIQSDISRARKQIGRGRLNEIGQEMGTEGLVGPTTTPHSTYERAGKLMDDAGAEMGGILKAADAQPGAALNTVDLLNRAGQDVLAPMLKDPHQAAAAEKLKNLLGRYADTYQAPGADGPVPADLTPSDLHAIRKNISKDLYGWRGNKDPDADAIKSALHDFRSVVSDELQKSIDRAGQSTPEWQKANRRYEVGAKAEEFADKGMDRSHGNNLISPMEALAGMTALAGGTAAGHAGAGLTGAAATLATALARRHGAGTLGWAAGGLSRGLRAAPSPSLRLDPQTTAILEALRAKLDPAAGLRLQSAGAEDDR